ncbi:MAG: DUF1348 family protein, partial [Novosphingobium sp.]
MEDRPPLPPFSRDTAISNVRASEDAWTSRDPARHPQADTLDRRWRNPAE